MTLGRPSIPVTEGLYGATAFLIVIGLVLQLLPSGGRLEARTAVSPEISKSPAGAIQGRDVLPSPDSGNSLTNVVTEPLPETYQSIIALNIFSPERRPPRKRYVLKEREGEQADQPPQLSVREPPRGPRLFGVTLRASGASALIEADARVPGAEIYRVGDPIAGGRLVEIGPSSVVIERRGDRQVIRLETVRPERAPSPNPPSDSLR
jgi:hypothetical protein